MTELRGECHGIPVIGRKRGPGASGDLAAWVRWLERRSCKHCAFLVRGATRWHNGAGGAYTILHDDLCAPDVEFDIADKELTSRGLRASFAAIVQFCSERELWDWLDTLRGHGHEIASHSWDHQRLTEVDNAPTTEIDQACVVLQQRLTDYRCEFFVFPW